MKISKRVVVAVTLAILGGGAMVVSAQAQDQARDQASQTAPHGVRGGMHGRGFVPMRGGAGGEFVSALLRAVHEEGLTTPALALTQAQKQQIMTLVQTAFKANAGKPAAPDITVVGNPASSGFAGAVQARQSAASSRVLAESNLATSIYQTVLTVQQQQALPTALQSLQTKAQQRRAAWQGRHSRPSNG